jgi:hypothetical protein
MEKLKKERENKMKIAFEETKKIVKNPLFRQIENRYKEDEESEFEKRKRHL